MRHHGRQWRGGASSRRYIVAKNQEQEEDERDGRRASAIPASEEQVALGKRPGTDPFLPHTWPLLEYTFVRGLGIKLALARHVKLMEPS